MGTGAHWDGEERPGGSRWSHDNSRGLGAIKWSTHQIIHQLTFGILENPKIFWKKTGKIEGDVLETTGGIRYSIFEAFANL